MMENQQQGSVMPKHSEEFLKKRKFYTAIPVLALPFLTMAFVALGGGEDGGKAKAAIPDHGIDMVLPSAQFRDTREKDKMDIYRSAGKDATKTKDGVNKSFIEAMGFNHSAEVSPDAEKPGKSFTTIPANTTDQQSARIEARLTQINRQINQPEPASYSQQSSDREIRRLHKLMKTMNSTNASDPEMEQLDHMLTKIQAIQNPESVKVPVAPKIENDSAFRAIPAIIDGKQKVMNGGTVKLKLTDSVNLKGITLPKGQLLFGACQVTNQRLLLNIQNIRIGKDILPTALTVFSLDGMPGIPAPEAELSGAASDGADNALQSMQFLSMDQTISAQAAAGGINAAKDLFSKKVRKIKVKLQDKFPVLLKINK